MDTSYDELIFVRCVLFSLKNLRTRQQVRNGSEENSEENSRVFIFRDGEHRTDSILFSFSITYKTQKELIETLGDYDYDLGRARAGW